MAGSTRTRIVGWIAVCAVLLDAYVPFVLHHRAAEGAPGLADVCTTDGVARVAMTNVPTGDQPAKTRLGAGGNCAHCCSGLAWHGAPPPDDILLKSVAGAQSANAPTVGIPHPLPLWRTPQSRAPPAIS